MVSFFDVTNRLFMDINIIFKFQSHATKRDHELQKKKSECDVLRKTKKSKAELESEKRDEGLQKSLDSSNKGFALLAKMGYKAGDSLGKSNTGIVEPIGFEVKNNRGGLGRETAKKQIKETKAKLRSLKKTSNSVPFSAEDFRASQSKKLKAKKVEGDLYRLVHCLLYRKVASRSLSDTSTSQFSISSTPIKVKN